MGYALSLSCSASRSKNIASDGRGEGNRCCEEAREAGAVVVEPTPAAEKDPPARSIPLEILAPPALSRGS